MSLGQVTDSQVLFFDLYRRNGSETLVRLRVQRILWKRRKELQETLEYSQGLIELVG